MAPEPAELRSRLADLHQQLQTTRTVSGDVRELLVEVLSDIDRLLASASQPQPATELEGGDLAGGDLAGGEPLESALSDNTALSDNATESNRLSRRLGDAARQFEDTHPQLAANIGSVVTALSQLGI